MRARLLRRLHHFIPRGILPAVSDIFIDRAGKKINVLLYHTDILPQALNRIPMDIFPVQQNLPLVNIIKPGNQIAQRRLSATGRTHNGNLLALMNLQI